MSPSAYILVPLHLSTVYQSKLMLKQPLSNLSLSDFYVQRSKCRLYYMNMFLSFYA